MTKQRGSMAVETVILTPIFVLLLVFVAYANRIVVAQHEISRAADIAARAASQSRTSSMSNRALETARLSMKENNSHCVSFMASVRRFSIEGAQQIEVRTQCKVNVLGLSLLGVRSPTLQAVSSEVIDVYRHP